LGVEGRLEGSVDSGKISPQVISMGAGELEVVSMGFLVDSEDTALMWRGLMLNRAVQHFLQDVEWGPLDYLLIDMPPGTGDVQMGLAKMLPHAEMLVITTPSTLAQSVAVRVANMGRNNYLRVAGVIENMSAFVDENGKTHEVFGTGGGNALAAQIDSPLIGQIPLDRAVVDGADDGTPAVLGGGAAADSFRAIAHQVITELIPPIDMSGCSTRIIDKALENLAEMDAAEAADEAASAS